MRRGATLLLVVAGGACASPSDPESARHVVPRGDLFTLAVPDRVRALDHDLARDLLATADEAGATLTPAVGLARTLATFPPAKVVLGGALPWDAAPGAEASAPDVNVYTWGPWAPEIGRAYILDVVLGGALRGPAYRFALDGAPPVDLATGEHDELDTRECWSAVVPGWSAAVSIETGWSPGLATRHLTYHGSDDVLTAVSDPRADTFDLVGEGPAGEIALTSRAEGSRLDAVLAGGARVVRCWDGAGVVVYSYDDTSGVPVETGVATSCAAQEIIEGVTCVSFE